MARDIDVRYTASPWFPPGPVTYAEVLIPDFTIKGSVQFLINTASPYSCLLPAAMEQLLYPLGISVGDFVSRIQSQGKQGRNFQCVGGVCRFIPMSGFVTFRRIDVKDSLMMELNPYIAEPTTHNSKLLSFLGRDILNKFRISLDYQSGRAKLTPH